MKNIILIFYLIIISSIVFAQNSGSKSSNSYLYESFEENYFPPKGWTKINPLGGNGWSLQDANTIFNDLYTSNLTQNKLSSKSLIWNWDTIITYDTLNVKQQRLTQTFDANYNVLSLLIEQWLSNAWTSLYRYSYTYDINGNILIEFVEEWQSNIWVNYTRNTYTYDISGNILTKLYEQWQSNAWANLYKFSFTYDSNGNMLTRLYEKWQNNSWVNYSRYTYTYDNNNNRLTWLYEQWQNNSWVNCNNSIYTYDSNNNLLTEFVEDWINNAWGNSWNYIYSYDTNGKMLTWLGDQWLNSTWENSFIHNYSYDVNGNMLSDVEEIFQNNIWVNFIRFIYTYDANENSLTGELEGWQNINWQPYQSQYWYISLYSNMIKTYNIYNIYRYEASYTSLISGVDNKYAKSNSITVYPNPANSSFTIKSYENNTTLKILNISGQLLKKVKVKDNENIIDIKDLTKGVYLLEIISDKNIFRSIVVKE